jgi:hypothetical protein
MLGKMARNVRLVDRDNLELEFLVSQAPAFPRTPYDLDEVRDKVVLECENLGEQQYCP